MCPSTSAFSLLALLSRRMPPGMLLWLTVLRMRSSLMRLADDIEGHTRDTLASSLWSLLSRLKGSCRQYSQTAQYSLYVSIHAHRALRCIAQRLQVGTTVSENALVQNIHAQRGP